MTNPLDETQSDQSDLSNPSDGSNPLDESNTPRPPTPVPGDLRVWHIPQIPGNPFYVYVADTHVAKLVLKLLAVYDEFLLEENIRGDFASVQGIERFEESGHNPGDPPFDWFEVDLDDLDEDRNDLLPKVPR